MVTGRAWVRMTGCSESTRSVGRAPFVPHSTLSWPPESAHSRRSHRARGHWPDRRRLQFVPSGQSTRAALRRPRVAQQHRQQPAGGALATTASCCSSPPPIRKLKSALSRGGKGWAPPSCSTSKLHAVSRRYSKNAHTSSPPPPPCPVPGCSSGFGVPPPVKGPWVRLCTVTLSGSDTRSRCQRFGFPRRFGLSGGISGPRFRLVAASY